MSFLSRRTTRPLSTLRFAPPITARSLHVTSFRSALSETDRDRDNRHEEIDAHKDDALKKQEEGKGHWKGELASQSEAALKADKEEVEASSETIEKMQKQTTEYAKAQHEGKK